MIKIILCIISVLFSITANADTIYMGPSEAYKTLRSAMAAMKSGDTLIIRDGIYTGVSNTIDSWNLPPNGLSKTQFTTISAEHPGKVIFDGEYTNRPVYINSNAAGTIRYIHFSGLIWKNSSDNNIVDFSGRSDAYNQFIWFSQCGFCDAKQTSGSNWTSALLLRYTDHALVENCYFWGQFYYGLYFLQCSNSIARQCVARNDIYMGPIGAPYCVYTSTNMELQNCIVIDCDNASTYTDVGTLHGFAYPTTNGPSTNIYSRGCIALNLHADGKFVSGLVSQNGGGSDFVFEDFIAYDTDGGFWDRLSGNTYTNCVFSESLGLEVAYGIHGDSSLLLTYSLVFGNIGTGSLVATSNYNNYYNNGTNGTTGTGDIFTNPLTNGYLFLPRVEAGSSLLASGIGPDVTKKIGIAGTFYGDTGYNVEADDSLWPFPNEAIIKTHFSGYAGNSNGSVTGTRGFCATGKQLNGTDDITLTSYIWEYLGNEIPADIYGAGPVFKAPTITGPNDFSTTAPSVEIGGTYTVDPDLPDKSVIITWTLGESSGFAVTALGVFSATVPVELGANSIVFEVTDSNSVTDTYTVVVTRTTSSPSSITSTAVSYGVVRY